MKLQLIRNATLRVTYGERLFVIDPFLAPKHSVRSFADISPNPLVDLPCLPGEVFEGVEMALISHLHVDHFDPLAQELIPKNIPVFCQPGDEAPLRDMGLPSVTPIEIIIDWQGITLIRTPGQHGTVSWLKRMGQVAGFVFRAPHEPTIYWAGDTIWYDVVQQVIAVIQPDVIITHSSGARFGSGDPIVMDAEQTITVCEAAPQATVVAVHMEALDHGTVSRADLRALADSRAIPAERLRIPADGERLSF